MRQVSGVKSIPLKEAPWSVVQGPKLAVTALLIHLFHELLLCTRHSEQEPAPHCTDVIICVHHDSKWIGKSCRISVTKEACLCAFQFRLVNLFFRYIWERPKEKSTWSLWREEWVVWPTDNSVMIPLVLQLPVGEVWRVQTWRQSAAAPRTAREWCSYKLWSLSETDLP